MVSADVLARVLGAWLWTRTAQAGGRLVIAIDGETVRGAKGKDGKAPHLVAALAHGIGTVLGQVAVDMKSNEIPAVRELLKAFADMAGAVLTIDAMHTQHDTAGLILGRGADYVMTIKANTHTLYKQLKKLPWAAVPAVSSVSRDHGRHARRTLKVALAPAWIGFDGAAQVAQLRRTVITKGTKTVEVVYLITSDLSGDPETLAFGSASTGTLRPSSTGSDAQAAPSCVNTTLPGSLRDLGKEIKKVVAACRRDRRKWHRRPGPSRQATLA